MRTLLLRAAFDDEIYATSSTDVVGSLRDNGGGKAVYRRILKYV